jgi:hypothetical protein
MKVLYRDPPIYWSEEEASFSVSEPLRTGDGSLTIYLMKRSSASCPDDANFHS